MRATSVFAPAKINLTLHVTGLRADGYHLLDSLVAFAPVGDGLVIEPGDTLSVTVEGPEAAGVPADMSNLVLKAAAFLAESAGVARGASFLLDKRLPPASGIGGGSSDAAAAIRGLMAFWELSPETDLDPAHVARAQDPAQQEAMTAEMPPRLAGLSRGLAKLGADVPMCLVPRPLRVGGIGEVLTRVDLPPLPALLVNPRVEVPTPAVFKALARKDNPAMPETLPNFAGTSDCIEWLATQRNDLQAPAIATAPVIAEVITELSTLPGCRLARMSGSGATCFALFETEDAARDAEVRLAAQRPGWWIASGNLGDQTQKAQPRSHAPSS
ncbi:MAG: 4-(cytidine 5'-diphospho)-2-C-methyl-D-erythritol kinase [Thioclava sp.]|nr:4-(cytidine 5'-diphospho)-2-C-methyl-D-erythritol kinase [Thioclava sp.]MBD3803149.1 4-(cytidine 5'-diphospho)-2-C-methyl-D-erythritol kinase [Thioclava sp.]